jgi:glucoamylase
MWSQKDNRFCRMATPRGDGTYDLDMTVDAACCSVWTFTALPPDNPQVVATMNAICEKLSVKTDIGGLARYQADPFQQAVPASNEIPGNPWIICTLWLAQYYIAAAKSLDDLNKALDILDWAVARALPSGVLAEQVHPLTGAPISISPLAWSHASFIMTVIEYLERLCELSGKPPQDLHTLGRGHLAFLDISHCWQE